MQPYKIYVVAFFALLITSNVKAQTNSPLKLLFIGNSFTYRNGGIEKHIKLMADNTKKPINIQVDKATKGGATLKIHFGIDSVHEKIKNGNNDIVILQEDIPEYKEHSVAPFFEYATLFEKEIALSKSKLVFFMAWPYERLNWISLDEIVAAHKSIAKQLNATVAPVGIALDRSLRIRPEMAMLGKDKEHESIHGTYLASCVIYATLFNKSLKGVSYWPEGITKQEARYLQALAWKTVKDWKKSN
ncbi:MAG: hypothetical protein NTW92_02350 [Bacteroidetes bacterium]|nr:hypothetical protein [Bacteroidota bacterium]